MKIKKLYELFVLLTNNLETVYKDIFVDMSEKTEIFRALTFKTIEVKMESSVVLSEDLTNYTTPISSKAYFWVRSLLTGTIKINPEFSADLCIVYRGIDYCISFSHGKVSGAPAELTNIINKSNVDKILMLYFIIDTTDYFYSETVDTALEYFIPKKSSDGKINPELSKYLDILNGAVSKPDTSIMSTLTDLKRSYEEHTKTLNDYQKLLNTLATEFETLEKQNTEQYQKFKGVEDTRKRVLNLKDEIDELTKQKDETIKSIEQAKEGVSLVDQAISAEIGKEYPNKEVLTSYREKKVIFQAIVDDGSKTLSRIDSVYLTAANNLRKYESELIDAGVVDDSVGEKIASVKHKIEACENRIRIVSSERDSIKSQISQEESKLGDISAIHDINFESVKKHLSEPAFLSSEQNVVHNFLVMLIKYYSEGTDQATLISTIRKIFSLK